MITFKIRGTVRIAETGVGLSGFFVKAYDKDLLFDDLLGSTYTDAGGCFEIITEQGDFRDFFEIRPDIYLKIFAPDAETLLYSTETSVRWNASRLEEFDVCIPAIFLGDWITQTQAQFVDENGELRTDYDVGESLFIRIQGIRAEAIHDIVLAGEEGQELFTVSLLSNAEGVIESTTLWPQFGLDDPHSGERFSVEQAQERWQGRALQLEVRDAGSKILEGQVRIAEEFSRPLLLSTDPEGKTLNGFELGKQEAIVSAYNLPFSGTVRVYMVLRQHDWQPGNSFRPVELASGREAFVDVEVDSDRPNFRAQIARRRELNPGAYDFIVRQLRYGYEDDEDFVLRSTDTVTRRVTGLVVRDDFMRSKAVLGGCVNMLPIAGRSILGPPYFRYTDTFQVGENIYGALDPAALDPNHQGKMVALYVIAHKAPGTWATDKSLAHLPQLGGNPAVPKLKTQTSCINHNMVPLWYNANTVGEYDVVADFGNNVPDASAFVTNASFDAPLDIIDGYFVAGFRVVPDPTTDTNFTQFGSYEYPNGAFNPGSKTVDDDGGLQVTVPLKAVVRFPADFAGATDPSQISGAQANYPLVVAVHGNGHDFHNYDYLLEHWAKNGFIAASIHLNGGMGGTGRAKILFEHLAILKNKFGSKAANNIGIMGHSRGGEAVVIAARINQQGSLGHNIKAIISLSPVDHYTNENLGGAWATPYFVLYGAMDGDVAGGSDRSWKTGFALYDRASGAKKSMAFVYGATHDRFNLINPDADIYWELGPTDRTQLLSAATHRTIAQAYMTAFFRWQLKNEAQWEGIFRGEWVPAAVAQAEAGKVKLYMQYSEQGDTVEPDLVDSFEGAHTPTSWQVSTLPGTVDDGNTLPVDPIEDELFDIDPHSPHDTSGLLLRWNDIGDKLEFKPSTPMNVGTLTAASFRVTQKVDSASNPAGQIQDLYLTLSDGNGNSRAIKVGKFGEIPPPQKRDKNQYTKSAMCTVRIPLHAFTIEVIGTQKVDLHNITTVSFQFMDKPTGEIEIDSLEFTN